MERRAVLIEYFSPLRITSSIFVGVSPSPEVAFGGGVDPAPCNQRCNPTIFYFLFPRGQDGLHDYRRTRGGIAVAYEAIEGIVLDGLGYYFKTKNTRLDTKLHH